MLSRSALRSITLVLGILAVPVSTLARDDATLRFDAPAAGAKSSLRFELTVTLPSNEGFLSGISVSTVSKVNGDAAEVTTDWDKFKLTVDGNETPIPFQPFKLTFGKDGDPTALSGGIEGSDPRIYEFFWFPRPDKALKKDEALTFT